MDDRGTRSEHARRIKELVNWLEVDGGDVLAVIVGELERFAIGVNRYGALDLDNPHDWQAEEDEERADIANYQAIRRTLARRGTETRSARRRAEQTAADVQMTEPAIGK